MVEQLYRQGGDERLSVTSTKVNENALPEHLMEEYTNIANHTDSEYELTASDVNECKTLAEKGHPEAQLVLGFFYASTGDDGEGVKWIQLAAIKVIQQLKGCLVCVNFSVGA